jgi:hypothetical protein
MYHNSEFIKKINKYFYLNIFIIHFERDYLIFLYKKIVFFDCDNLRKLIQYEFQHENL